MTEVFKDEEHLYSILVPFFEKIRETPVMGDKLFSSGLTVQFRYTEPDAVITVDCPERNIIGGATEIVPMVEMSMKSITAHKFWLGKVNLMVALTKREITAKGPIPQIMKLLPVMKDAYPMYNEYMKELGMEDTIDV